MARVPAALLQPRRRGRIPHTAGGVQEVVLDHDGDGVRAELHADRQGLALRPHGVLRLVELVRVDVDDGAPGGGPCHNGEDLLQALEVVLLRELLQETMVVRGGGDFRECGSPRAELGGSRGLGGQHSPGTEKGERGTGVE